VSATLSSLGKILIGKNLVEVIIFRLDIHNRSWIQTKMTKEEIKEYEDCMNDDYKSWQDAENEIKNAIKWRDKKALWYAESTVKYYNAKKTLE
jgi:ribosomal protein S13